MKITELFEALQKYKRDNPELESIMKKLNIDEQTYIQSMQHLTDNNKDKYESLLTNTTCIR